MAHRSRPTRLDLGDYLPFLVNRVGVSLVAAFDAEVARHGLSVPMWRVLAVLAEDGPLRQVDLAARTSIETSTLSRLVGAVQRRGYVSRARSTASLREVTIALTARGRAVVRDLVPHARDLEARAIGDLGAAEVAQLKRLLRRVYASLAP